MSIGGGVSKIMPQKILSVIRQCQNNHSGDKIAMGPNLLFLCLRKLQFFPILKCKSNLSLHSTTMHTHNNIPYNPLIWLLKALQYLPFVYGTKFKILRTPQDLIYLSSSSQPKSPGSLCSRYTHLFWVLQWNIRPLISGDMSQESSHLLFLTVALANLCIKSPLQCHSQSTLNFW